MTLTKRQREVLTIMRDNRHTDDGELVYERGRGYLGLEPVAPRTLYALLRLCAIDLDTPQNDIGRGVERYTINETGEALLTANDQVVFE